MSPEPTTTARETRKAERAFRADAAPPRAAAQVPVDAEARSVAAVFPTLERAEDAIERLFRAGFHVEQMSLVTPAPERRGLDEVDAVEAPPARSRRWGAAGGVLGALAGSSVAIGFVSTAGLGALAVAGPLFVGLAGGAIVGSLIGAMLRRGVAPDDVKRYVRAACDGGTLLLVDVTDDEQARQAQAAFDEAGARHEA